MPSRVNTKFVLILVASGLCVLGIVGVLWLLQYRGDTERHMRQGEDFMRTGELRQAYIAYGRAVRKEPSNLAYLDKFEEVLLQLRPESRDEADELYLKRLGTLRQTVRYDRQNPQAHLDLIEELRYAAHLANDAEAWQEVASAADAMWNDVPATEPLRIEAKLYQAMGVIRDTTMIGEAELLEAIKKLDEYLQERPTSDRGWMSLVRGYLVLHEKARSQGNARRADELLKKAEQSIERARTAAPDGPEVARAVTVALAVRRNQVPGSVPIKELEEAVDRMVELVKESDDGLLVLETAENLQALGGLAPRAAELLEHYLESHPDAINHRAMLVELLYQQNDLDRAGAEVQHIIQAEPLPVSIEARYQWLLKRKAQSLLVDIAHSRWMAAEGDQQGAAIEEIERALEDLREVTTDPENDPLFLKARAKLAYARSDHRTAAAIFDKLSIDPTTRSREVLWFAARSLQEIQEYGRAYSRLQQILERYPEDTLALYEAARLAHNMRRRTEAQEHVEKLLVADPDHAAGKRLKSLISIGDEETDTESLDPVARALVVAEQALKEESADRAREGLLVVLDEDPRNPQVLRMLLRVELAAGRPDDARRYVEFLLEQYPTDPWLKMVHASLLEDDQVKAIQHYVASLGLSDADATVRLLLHLSSLANSQRGRAEQLEASGDAEAAAVARDLAERADAAAREAMSQAEVLAADHPQLQEHLFYQALGDEDWTTAERIAQQARRADTDLAGGALFGGQLAFARGRWEEAVRQLGEATRRIPHSSRAWRLLGLAYQRLGNLGAARTAFERAYENNPNDVDTVRRYVGLLDLVGDEVRALRVMRVARRLVPDDVRLREDWLQLEGALGDPVTVLKQRREIYQENPRDRRNAEGLVRLLATLEPNRDLILDRNGDPVFSHAEWGRRDVRDQQAAIVQAKQRWYAEADSILDELASQSDDKLSVARLRSLLLREQGRVEEGETVLRELIEVTPEDEVALEMLLALGSYQVEVGRIEAAIATLDRARQHQDPVVREADIAMGNLFFGLGAMFDDFYNRAVQAYRRAVEVNADEAIERRIVQCLVRLQRFDEAEQSLRRRLENGGGYEDQMLRAELAQAHGDDLARRGRQQEADSRFADRDAALDEARQLNPSEPQPHIQRATAKLQEFYRRLEGASIEEAKLMRSQSPLLQEALRSLERADEVRSGSAATSLVRATVLQAQGDTAAAIGELSRLLAGSPQEVGARRRLVQLYYEQGNRDAAHQTLRDGISRNPGLVTWHEQQGDLYLNDALVLKRSGGDAAEAAQMAANAAESYQRAVELQPSVPLLGKLTSALMETDPPRYAEAAAAMEQHAQQTEANPRLRSLYARVLEGLGRRDEALAGLREAYQQLRESAEGFGGPSWVQWQRSIEAIFAGRPVSEMEAFVNQIAADDPDAFELSWLASLWAQEGSSGLSRALELQQRAIGKYEGQNASTKAAMLHALAVFMLMDGQFRAAMDPFQQVIELVPDHKHALNNYAYLLATQLRRPQDALPYSQRANDLLAPNDPKRLKADFRDTLGYIYFLMNRLREAERELRDSVLLEETASNCLHLARVLAESGNLDAAQIHLERAAELQPDAKTKAEIDALADDIRTRRR